MVSSTPFSSSLEVYEWISGFINLERDKSFRSFRLDRMKILAELAGNPEACAPAIHVAGSKGKGSVTGMIASILNHSGYQCGCYASPHVMDFRERLSLGTRFFDEKTYQEAGDELRQITEKLIISDNPEYAVFQKGNETGEEPTFFELMTLWFFLCSRRAKVKAMAVETGMGGRLDATNILDPAASVITIIELEHTEILGNTITAIAGEKAGIIKKGRPVIVARQKEEALEVFQQKARETQSPLFYFPEYAEIHDVKIQKEGTFFGLKLQNPRDGKLQHFKDLRLSISGEIQAENAGLALLAVRIAFPEIPDKAIEKGLADFSLPGRFQCILSDPVLVIDAAHTFRSAESCVKTFTCLYGNQGILIFGCGADKNTRAMAEVFIPEFSRIIITTPGTFKKSFPEEVYQTFIQTANENGHRLEIQFIPETEKALKAALELAKDLKLPILGTGSFYLIAELWKACG
jgi:dihydrofolate synthase/folylpolyglutamate synthase